LIQLVFSIGLIFSTYKASIDVVIYLKALPGVLM
jgi:hypothetical protein